MGLFLAGRGIHLEDGGEEQGRKSDSFVQRELDQERQEVRLA